MERLTRRAAGSFRPVSSQPVHFHLISRGRRAPSSSGRPDFPGPAQPAAPTSATSFPNARSCSRSIRSAAHSEACSPWCVTVTPSGPPALAPLVRTCSLVPCPYPLKPPGKPGRFIYRLRDRLALEGIPPPPARALRARDVPKTANRN